MEELNLIFQNLNINDIMADHQIQQQQIPPLKIVNDPPVFSGNKRELDGFLTRVELAINAHPQRFISDAMRVNFVISYLNGKALNWASCLRRNNNAILNNLEHLEETLEILISKLK